MRRRTTTLERPAARPAYGAFDPRTREAHRMPSVVEGYGTRRGDEPPRDASTSAQPRPAPGTSSPGEMPVSVETLQKLIAHLVSDDVTARQIQVNPTKALRRIPFLTESDRKRLSGLNSEILESLADAANRYARAAREVNYGSIPIPLGPKGGAMGRGLEGIAGLAGKGPLGRGGAPADIAPWIVGSGPRPADFGIPGVGRGGATGDGAGRSGTGGLSRGQRTALGIPGASSSEDYGAGFGFDQVGPGMGGGGAGIDLGFLGGFGRRGDPLVNARAWHRLHPGGGVGGEPGDADYGSIFGPDWEDPGYGGTYAQPMHYPSGTWGAAVAEGWVSPEAQSPEEVAKWEEKWGPSKVYPTILRTNAPPPVLSPPPPPNANPPGVPPPPPPPKPPKGQTGGNPNPDDPGGPVGPWVRTGIFRGSLAAMPNPEGTGPVGPWVRASVSRRQHEDAMPNPDDPGGGRPIGPWARTGRVGLASGLFTPAPDDPGPGTPYSRATSALADLRGAMAALLRRTSR